MSLLAWFPLDSTTENRGSLGNIISPSVAITPIYELGKTGYTMKEGQLHLSAAETEKLLHRTTSFAFWIKPLNGGGGQIFGNYPTSAGKNNRKFSLFQYPTGSDFHWWIQRDEDNEGYLDAGTYEGVLPINEWTHVAFVADAQHGTLKIYFNAVLKETKSVNLNSGTMSFDVDTTLFHNNPNRLLCDFRIYDHALCEKEVHELYKACIVHYNFEDLSGISEYKELNLGDASGWLRVGHATRIKATTSNIGTTAGNIPGSADASYPIEILHFNPSFLTNCTFCFWYKANDWGSGILYANDENRGRYLGAMNGESTWSYGASYTAAYVDGSSRLGCMLDKNWHFYCLTGVNISSWSKIYINRHGDNGWNFRGDMADFKIYATALTADEVMQEYKSRVHLLNGGQIAARSFKEDYSFIHGPICPENMGAAGGAGFTSEVLNDPVSFTGRVVKGTCVVAGNGPYISPCPKSVLTHGHKYVMSFMAKSDNKTSFTYTYEASNGAEKPIKTNLTSEWQEYSLLITANTSSTYEALTFYCGWEVGENIYLCNFQAKDVTNVKIRKEGVAQVNELNELTNITKIYNDGRISTAEAIEL